MIAVDEFELWLSQARRDLDAARSLQRGGFHEWVHYCCQQSAEKALKAYFVALNFEVPRDHDLSKLSDPWRKGVSSARPELRQTFATLNSDTKDFKDRYPTKSDMPANLYGDADSVDAIKSAEEVLRFCEPLARRASEFKKSIR